MKKVLNFLVLCLMVVMLNGCAHLLLGGLLGAAAVGTAALVAPRPYYRPYPYYNPYYRPYVRPYNRYYPY